MSKRSIEKFNEPLYQREALRFECTGCGACCVASGDYYVYVTKNEIEKIGDFLGLSRAWFKRRYLQRLPDEGPEEGWVLAVSDDDLCVFLGKDRRCSVYSVRPAQCSSYPYWPEVVLRKSDWLRESRRCEGIGRGKIVSKKMIAALLEKQADND